MATAEESSGQRTFHAALGVRKALEKQGLIPTKANVFTLEAHARRSRLIYAKALGERCEVGTISWIPPEDRSGPWWNSSERAEALIKETIGYLFELLLNSGRLSNSPDGAAG